MVIQQEGACAYHQQQASGGIRGGSGSAGGGEGVVEDFLVVESGPTVEVGQGDGLFVILKVYLLLSQLPSPSQLSCKGRDPE